MRRLVVAVSLVVGTHAAQAADMPDLLGNLPVLRGALPVTGLTRATTNWEGYYVGGQAGYGSASMDFAKSTQDMLAFILAGTTIQNENNVSGWQVLGKSTNTGASYGGFAGYNMQWDEAVIGFELNYNHANYNGSASNTMARSFTTSDGYLNDVSVTGTASMKLKDFGTARLRLGWAEGNMLAYGVLGVAVGRADISRAVSVTAQGTNSSTSATYGPTTKTDSSTQLDKFIYGYAFGLGVDYAVAGNIFLRGEWEYVAFTGDVATNVNTVRGGVGVKF